ncbi:MAG TPA: class I SAM-dependent methyltransferase, partial [Acidimicrobiia bacterium]|nr:class I SAM-dependent methyltransferase [Acidimicrobiia bacterium]
QFHFDPATYLTLIRSAVPEYDRVQAEIGDAVRAWRGATAPRVCDLGAGTGETAGAVLAARPDAQLVLVDENPAMLGVARDILPAGNVERVVVADLADPLPAGPFDLVVSALAIHHLDGPAKRALFADVHDRLRAGGRFAMADVVVPDNPADVVAPLSASYDKPDRAVDLLEWLHAAGFRAECVWSSHDLAAFVAQR